MCRTTDSILCSLLQWSLASRWSIAKKGPGTSLRHASKCYRSTWGGFWTNSHYTPLRWLISWTCNARVFVILTCIIAQLTSFYLVFSLQLSHGYYIIYHHSVSCAYTGIYCLIIWLGMGGLAWRVWSIYQFVLDSTDLESPSPSVLSASFSLLLWLLPAWNIRQNWSRNQRAWKVKVDAMDGGRLMKCVHSDHEEVIGRMPRGRPRKRWTDNSNYEPSAC